MPRIAVTLGDPRGIGPEVAVRAFAEPEPLRAEVVLIGPERLPGTEEYDLVGVGRWQPHGDDRLAGRLAGAAIERAVELAMQGTVDAIVTAPIAKPALAAAGYRWPGHTEMLRDLTGVPETALCMTVEGASHPPPSTLRVVLVTGHLPLREVPHAFTIDRICRIGRLAHRDLVRWWGIERPRLALCGLNPHASDRGMFGDEEARICEPATAQLRSEGLDITGPWAADTVFLRAMHGEWDAVLAPYHDVGMVAVKTAGFGAAVNVTLGLPFARTSPDHGTAFDIAGTGRANPRSMRAALELAVRFANRSLTARTASDTLPGE